MTIDEAIRREFLIAANEIREYDGDNEEIRLSALYHKQLAEWLKELKMIRDKVANMDGSKDFAEYVKGIFNGEK